MARDISELGADVFDDTVVVNKSKISPKKRNYIIGLSITGVLLAGAITASVILCNTVLLDYANVTNVTYYFTPQTALEEGQESTAVLYKLQSDVTYPSTFRIPSQVKGYKVVGVAEEAFAGHTEIKHVIFPNTVEFVGERAFAGCENLSKFTWGKKLYDIGVDAFDGTAFYNNLLKQTNILYDLPSGVLIYVGKDYLPQGIALVSDELPESEYASIKAEYGSTSVKKFSEYNIRNFCSGAFKGNDKITYIDLPKGITEISKSTFEGCYNLQGLDTTHSSLTKIGVRGFAECYALNYIKLKDTVDTLEDEAFRGIGLTDSIPDLTHVELLGDFLFAECSELTGLTYDLTIVPNYMFAGCSNLATIEWGVDDAKIDTVDSFGLGAFMGTKFSEFVVPKNVTSIEDETFEGCTSLTKVMFYGNPNYELMPDLGGSYIDDDGVEREGVLKGLQLIKASAFDGCTSLATIGLYGDDYLDWDVTPNEFHFPRSLEKTDINTTVSGSNNRVFYGSAATKVVFSANTKAIGSYAFANNSLLEEVEFKNADKSRLTTVKKNAFENCSSLQSLTFPASLESVEASAFKNCTSITSIDLGSTKIKSIPSELFNNCPELVSASIPNSVTNVKSNAYYQNYKLEYVILPTSITELQSKAFTKMRLDGEGTMPIFFAWGAGDTTRRNIASSWKDITVQEYYFLAEGEEKVEGKHYWQYVAGVPTIVD